MLVMNPDPGHIISPWSAGQIQLNALTQDHTQTCALVPHCSTDMCTNTCCLTWCETCALLRSELRGLGNSRFQLDAWGLRHDVALWEKLQAIIHQMNQLRFWSECQISDSLSFPQIRMPVACIADIKTHFSPLCIVTAGQISKWSK